jgi:hypothetical protein
MYCKSFLFPQYNTVYWATDISDESVATVLSVEKEDKEIMVKQIASSTLFPRNVGSLQQTKRSCMPENEALHNHLC